MSNKSQSQKVPSMSGCHGENIKPILTCPLKTSISHELHHLNVCKYITLPTYQQKAGLHNA